MAKGVGGVDRRKVADWFSGLSFEVQQSVLDDFGKAMEAKAGRIAALEKELASLRGQRGPSVARSVSKPVEKARLGSKVSPKKGVKLEPKYRHPKTGETWAGRGVYPTWINEYLKKRGNKLDDLLIKK
jgi:DNA-binding protein H-NS